MKISFDASKIDGCLCTTASEDSTISTESTLSFDPRWYSGEVECGVTMKRTDYKDPMVVVIRHVEVRLEA
ncbi:MAG: hypothetical protein MJZ81_09660 [Bacteroidales bacterium]|nr:hypothetical protein [Bacteroidales bacterium]